MTTRPDQRPSLPVRLPAARSLVCNNGLGNNGLGNNGLGNNGLGNNGLGNIHRRMAHVCRCLMLLLALNTLLPQSALARQALPDPTRPAIGTSQPGEVEEAIGGPKLQSILISPTRKLAVINGQTLQVGAQVGNAVLVKISAQEVVLKSGSELQTLKLFPGVEKRKSSAGKVASQKMKD